MKLYIDGHEVVANPGETLLDLIHKLSFDCSLLSQRPLAAKIAGEVFNLNYVPVRQKDRMMPFPMWTDFFTFMWRTRHR